MATIEDVQLTSYKEDVLEELVENVLKGLKAIGEEAEGFAKDVCPVDTGLLRNSLTYAISGEAPAITIAKSDDETKSVSYSGTAPEPTGGTYSLYVGTNVEYAQKQELVEMRHHAGQRAHFLRDSIAQHGARYQELMEAALDT